MVSSVIIVIMRPDLIASFALLVGLLVCSEQPQKCRHETWVVCQTGTAISMLLVRFIILIWEHEEGLAIKSVDCSSAVNTSRLERLYRLSLTNPLDS
jgi:hypothetical protein